MPISTFTLSTDCVGRVNAFMGAETLAASAPGYGSRHAERAAAASVTAVMPSGAAGSYLGGSYRKERELVT